MTIKFFPDMSGRIVFGGYPHEYDNNKIYDPNNLITIYTGSIGNIFLPWSLGFYSSYFIIDGNIEIEVQRYALCYLVFNFGLIKGTKKYKELILKYYFQELIDKNICQEKTENTIFDRKVSSINSNGTFTMFICDKTTFKGKYLYKFPSFKLKHQGFNYTFELIYKDLFLEIKNKYYFLMIFPEDDSSQWFFGIPFLKKYEFVFKLIFFIKLNIFLFS